MPSSTWNWFVDNIAFRCPCWTGYRRSWFTVVNTTSWSWELTWNKMNSTAWYRFIYSTSLWWYSTGWFAWIDITRWSWKFAGMNWLIIWRSISSRRSNTWSLTWANNRFIYNLAFRSPGWARNWVSRYEIMNTSVWAWEWTFATWATRFRSS